MSQLGFALPAARPPREPLDLPDAEVWLQRGWLERGQADALFARLVADVPWRQDHITLYGKTHEVPRLTAWYGDPGRVYTWSGVRMEPLPWEGAVEAIRAAVEREVGVRFDSALLNLYRDGRDSVAWHADDEPELGRDPVIASVSLGATRTFRLRHLHRDLPAVDLELDHGSLLVMAGATQRSWHHAVPRRLRVHDPRINLTFRRIRPA